MNIEELEESLQAQFPGTTLVASTDFLWDQLKAKDARIDALEKALKEFMDTTDDYGQNFLPYESYVRIQALLGENDENP